MYSVGASSEFFNIYRDLGEKYNLPVLINEQLMNIVGLNPKLDIKERDFLIDRIYIGEFEFFKAGKLNSYYSSILEQLTNGLNLILIHPALDNEEMKGITVNHPNFGSEWRQIDLDFFTDELNKSKLIENNIELITWNDIKNRKIKVHNNSNHGASL